MIRVRSTHGAPCCGVLPGVEKEVDETNRGVASALAAGLLVRVGEGAEKAPTDDGRGARIAALEAELAQVKLDLEAATAPPAGKPPKKPAASAEG